MGLSFLDFLRKCLSRCPNFKKPCQPWKFSGCAPAYIWYKQSGFCSLNFIGSIYRNLGGLVVWYLERWPGFDSQPGSILSTLNYLQVNYLHRFSCRMLDQKTFSAILHQNIIRQNKFFNFSPNFLHFLCWFGYSNNNSILGYIYLQGCKLVIANSQIKIFPIMLLWQLSFGVLLT